MWISKKTGLSIEDVVEALEGLSVLGHLKKEAGGFYPVKGKELCSFGWSGKSKAQVIDEHLVVTHQILNDMQVDRTVAIDHGFIAGNKELITELYQDIKAAIDKALEKSQKNKAANDGIYKITFSSVDVISKTPAKSTGGAT